jgi:hypothetical protein
MSVDRVKVRTDDVHQEIIVSRGEHRVHMRIDGMNREEALLFRRVVFDVDRMIRQLVIDEAATVLGLEET